MNVNAVKHIRDVINAEGGVIPFSRFMSLALYHPDVGYYMAPHEKFGPKGDFITAPLVSPLYAQTLAKSIVDDVKAHPFIMEWGAGNGQLAKDMLAYLAEQGLHPHYAIYDVSPACRAMQRETLAAFGEQVSWLDTPPESFEGVILANEVLDALPVDVFHYKNGELFERCVTWVDNHFEWVGRMVGANNVLPIPNHDDYISETHHAADVLMQTWLNMLKAGKLIIIDYGFLEHEYYHPSRTRGTLMCHYHHTAHDDPFIHVGEQDITAHVNFSTCIDMAVAAGADVTFYTQAQYLMAHGLMDLAQACFSEDIAKQRLVSQAIRVLVDPQDMGEMFKVLVVMQCGGAS
ncbi:MAG: class I SAM-dependent methyltransferase [Gammaproteobacteria bacterium]